MTEKRPPLIHIGYHKTGTTWLQRHIFSDRSRFAQVRPRTLIDQAFVVCNPFRFDAEEAHSYMNAFFEQAEADGTVPVISHERLVGQPGQSGVDARMIADRIAATYPEGRVLIVIREQRAMLFSMYSQYLKRFGKDRFEHVWRDRTIREQRRFSPTTRVYEYHDLIGYYQKLFGRERVLVLPFEALRADATAFVADICRFAGVEPMDTVPTNRSNVAVPGGALALVRWINKLFSMIGLSNTFSGPVADRRIRRIRLRIIESLGPRVPARISKRVEEGWRRSALEIAGDRFAESNKITQELTGLDLASYGYTV